MSNDDYYKKSDEDSEDEFAGFSIVDDQGVEVERLKKLLKEAVTLDEPTIATAIPEDELMVLMDNAAVVLPQVGTPVDFKFCYEGEVAKGSVYFEGKKIGDFKPAFVNRLFSTRKDQPCKAYVHSDSPLMIKLVFKGEGKRVAAG